VNGSSLDARIAGLEDRLFRRYGTGAVTHLLRPGPNGLALRVHDIGDGPPVLLLHPAAFFGAHWAPIVPHLAGHRLLAVDQPGHGLSEGIDYRGLDLRAVTVAWLVGVLDALGLDRVVAVGNSLGGMAALWLAVARPDRLSGLMVVGAPAAALPGVRVDPGLRLLAHPGLNRRAVEIPMGRWFVRAALRGPLGKRALEQAPPESLEIYRLAARRAAWRLTLPSLMEKLVQGKETRPEVALRDDELRALDVPTLFLWGEQDRYGGTGMGYRAAALMPRADVVVWEGAGHLPQYDDPREFGRLVGRFVSSAARMSSAAAIPLVPG
jgi:pimeloyl-ACP methyl ester carboxylesterase